MELNVDRIEILLLVAAIVAMLARRFRFPYTVGLVLTGVAMTHFSFGPVLTMTKELIFTVLLPPLIFEAAIFLHWHALRKELAVVITMATLGVMLAAGIVMVGMHYFMGWPLLAAGVFGALIAATDPVSVIATFKENGVGGRLRLLVEAESLFNDGTAAVMFGVLLAIAQGVALSPGDIALSVILTVGGGIGCGALVAVIVLYLAGKTTDHLIEITFTTVAAYGSFLLAEHFHWSGVLATLTAGLIIGTRGSLGAISPKGREAVEAFWEYAAFAANSLIFLLIGIHEAKQDFSTLWPTALVAIALVIAGRAVAIYPVAWLFGRSTAKLTWAHQHIMFWGGLRGALSLALALGLPPDLPYREQIVTAAFAVVAFSVIVQGLSMTSLLRYFDEIGRSQHHG
jgi:CPA1 family monovalent cation:H+ antiporter